MTDAATETPTANPPKLTTIHSTAEIEALIPHRWPILLVDRIVEYDAEAKRIVGIKGVAATEWFFQGHFPGLPVVPGVIQVEALAQTMAVYVAKQPGFGSRIGLFAGIDDVRWAVRIPRPFAIGVLDQIEQRKPFDEARSSGAIDGRLLVGPVHVCEFGTVEFHTDEFKKVPPKFGPISCGGVVMYSWRIGYEDVVVVIWNSLLVDVGTVVIRVVLECVKRR